MKKPRCEELKYFITDFSPFCSSFTLVSYTFKLKKELKYSLLGCQSAPTSTPYLPGVMNKYHLNGSPLGVNVCVHRAPPRATGHLQEYFSGIQSRLLCKQKALHSPPVQVAVCAEEADALSEPSEPLQDRDMTSSV